MTQAELDSLSAGEEGSSDGSSSPTAGALRRAKAYGQCLQPVAESDSQNASSHQVSGSTGVVPEENLHALSSKDGDEGDQVTSTSRKKKNKNQGSWSDMQMENRDFLSQIDQTEGGEMKASKVETHKTQWTSDDGLSQVALDALSQGSNVEEGAPSSPQAS